MINPRIIDANRWNRWLSQTFCPTKVLVPTAGATWQGLKNMGRALSTAAEWTYGYVLRPLAGELLPAHRVVHQGFLFFLRVFLVGSDWNMDLIFPYIGNSNPN